MTPSASDRLARLDRFAGPMWAVSVMSLAGLAVVLHFFERHEFGIAFWSGLVVSAALWPCYVAEAIWAWRVDSPRFRERLWCLALPPLRLAARDHETGARMWLPGLGWQMVSRELRQRLERASSAPMMLVALAVLPMIAVEYVFAEAVEQDAWLAASVAAATALIWFAFTFEFVVMCSLAENKLDYCLKHWLDLAVILLPLVAFLRALRLGRLLRLQQLGRTARVYKLRGTVMRAWRALLVLEIMRRLIQGRPEKRMARLTELIAQKERELAELQEERAALAGAFDSRSAPISHRAA
jgi:voltage-gated potassium channel